MASTPKVVRRLAKKTQREASNYFGFPINANVHFGAENISRTVKKGGKSKSSITLDRKLKNGGKIPLKETQKILEHEFFHAGHDSFMLKKAGFASGAVSEAVAMIANAEHVIKAKSFNPQIYQKYLTHQENRLAKNPPENPTHLAGLKIMLNILRKFPEPKTRQRFIQGLLEENAQTIKKARLTPSSRVLITGVGQLRKVDELV